MPDKFFVYVYLDLPDSVTDMVGNAQAVLAGNDLRLAIEALVKEKAETAVLTFGVQKENIPEPPKVKAERKPRTPKDIPGLPAADQGTTVTEQPAPVPEAPQPAQEAPPARHGRRAAA